nr:hypothetical protein Q903MT_gene5134 [Picea sitchensis]
MCLMFTTFRYGFVSHKKDDMGVFLVHLNSVLVFSHNVFILFHHLFSTAKSSSRGLKRTKSSYILFCMW